MRIHLGPLGPPPRTDPLPYPGQPLHPAATWGDNVRYVREALARGAPRLPLHPWVQYRAP